LEPWLDDNKKRLKDKEPQRQQVKMIPKHMAIGDYKQFKHAKHGGGFEGRKGKGHVEYKDHLHKDAHHSFSMLSTMLKHGGGHAALHYDHRKGW
jgi:hypothetical protein